MTIKKIQKVHLIDGKENIFPKKSKNFFKRDKKNLKSAPERGRDNRKKEKERIMKNFLKKNFSSIIPQWLADYRPGEEDEKNIFAADVNQLFIV